MAGATIADLLVKIGADLTELKTALQESEGDLEAFRSGVEGGAGSLAQLGLAAAAAGTAIVGFLGVSAKAAAASQKEIKLLEQALRAAGRSADTRPYEDQAAALQSLTGVSDEAILNIQRLLVNFGASADKVRELTPRILDFSAATGRDAASAALIFGRALTGQDQALKRVLGKMGEGVDLAENFGRAMQLLDVRFGGAARTIGQTLPGALSILKNQFSDLLEIVGAPLLAPLTALVNALAGVLKGITDIAKGQPILTAMFTGAAAAIGLFMLGAGGVIALRAVLPQVTGALHAMTAALLGQKLVTAGLSAETVRLIAVQTLLKAVLPQAVLVAAIGAASLALIEMIRVIRESDEAVRRSRDVTVETSGALRDRIKDISQLNQALEDAARGFKLLAAEQKVAAAEIAGKRLSAQGLTVEQVQKIERDRANAARKADEQEIRSTIDKTKQLIAQIRLRQKVLGDDKEISKELEAAQTKLADLTISLQDSVLRNELQVQKERAAAARELVELKARAETEAIQRASNILRSQLDASRSIDAERLRSEEEGRQRRLAVVRLENDLRLEAIKRAIEVQRRFEEDALSVRESIARARSARFETLAIQEGAARAEAVRQGFLTEEQAQVQADEKRRARIAAEIKDQVDLADRRVALIQQNLSREKQAAAEEAAIRVALLDSEIQAETQAAMTRERIKEGELRTAIAIARAETQARKAEVAARLNAEITAAQAALILARSPQEAELRAKALDELRALRDQSLDEQTKSQLDKERALADQLVLVQQGALGEIDALQQRSALRRTQIAAELSASLARLESASSAERAKAAQDIAELQSRLARDLVNEEEVLRKQFEGGKITQAQMDERLRPLRQLSALIARTTTQRLADADTLLGKLDDWKSAVAARVEALRPLADALRGSAGKITLPGTGPLVQPAAVAVGAGAGQVTNLFTFQGTTFNLTEDEASLLKRIVKAIMGPEFNKAVEDHFKSIPGPRGNAR